MTTYLVTSFDGNFTILADTMDVSNTALSLPGKDFVGWGQAYSNNFEHLLENFAIGEPSIKRTGQLWYDTSVSSLKVWDSRQNSGAGKWTVIGQDAQTSVTAQRLANARTIAISGAGTGSVSFDGSANVTIPLTLATTGVSAGSYTYANVTVNAQGLVTAASSGVFAPTVTSWTAPGITARTGAVVLTSADVIAALGFTPSSGLADSGVTPGTYTLPQFTVDEFGRITAASSVGITSSDVITALGYTPLSGLSPSGVSPGSYTSANITVDTYGRVTSASSGGNSGAVPTGAVFHFASTSPPSGYFVCDGSVRSRSTYSALFAICGTTYGVGDGSTTFNLPDLRGEFVRGYDSGRGVDTGRTFGSTQQPALQDHTHNWGFSGTNSGGVGTPAIFGGGDVRFQNPTGAPTGHAMSTGPNTLITQSDPRPTNVALLPCIKY